MGTLSYPQVSSGGGGGGTIVNNINTNDAGTASRVPYFTSTGPPYTLTVAGGGGPLSGLFATQSANSTFYTRSDNNAGQFITTCSFDTNSGGANVGAQFAQTTPAKENRIAISASDDSQRITASATNGNVADLSFVTAAYTGTPSSGNFEFRSDLSNGGRITSTQDWSSTGALHAFTVNVRSNSGPVAGGSTLFRVQLAGSNVFSVTTTGAVTGSSFSGSGASLTGVDASTLGGATFASPGAIGGGTASSGTFTTGTFNGAVSVTTANALGGLTLTAGTGTNAATQRFVNTGGTYTVGVDNSAGGNFGSSYAMVFNAPAGRVIDTRIDTALVTRVNSAGLDVTGALSVSGNVSIGNNVAAAVAVASTHKVTMVIGGVTYYLLATNV